MIRNQNIGLIILICIFLTGCTTMEPKYSRPKSPVPEHWPDQSSIKETSGLQAADVAWADFYRDEHLCQVIKMALENNRDLKIATLNIEKAQALYQIQRSELFPSLNLPAGFSKQHIPADVSGIGRERTSEQYTVSLGVSSWEIDFFGRIRSLKESMLEQYLATEQAKHSIQISLVGPVATAYMNLAASQAYLKLAQDTLDNQTAYYQLIRSRVEKGIASELEASQAQTRVEAARVDVARYTNQVAASENMLNLLVGTPVPKELLPNMLDDHLMREDLTAGISSEVLLHRPDVLMAENQLKAANANIGAARAAFFPNISLTGTYGTMSTELSGLFKGRSDTWSFVPQIVQPIFDAGARRQRLKVAQVDREIYLAQYEKAIQTAFREVADNLVERSTLVEQLAAQEALVKSSEEAFRLATLRYTEGITNYLNVLDTQRSLYSAQQGLLAVRLARNLNLILFYKVLGGGAF
ncbi:MAG TPA: efflux transporter outer membrane subunit [bacterium]|nr:efflux transporter outer membrane subunit [bacterium]